METRSYQSRCYVYVQTAHSCGGDGRVEQDPSTALQLEGQEERGGGKEREKEERKINHKERGND